MTTIDNNALLQLQVDCGIPHTPTALTYELRLAVSGEGPRAYDWSDKPHRLLYDACREIERNAKCIVQMVGNQTWLLDPKVTKPYSIQHSTFKLSEDSDEAKKKFTFDFSYWSCAETDSHYASQEKV